MVILEEGKPKRGEYAERNHNKKVERQAKIKREFQEKRDKSIEFIWSVSLNKHINNTFIA